MRRGRREKIEKNSNIKYLVYASGGIVLIMIITFITTLIIYNNKIKDSSYSSLTTEKIAELVPNNTEIEQANTDIGKTIEEVINEVEEKEDISKENEKVSEIPKQENKVKKATVKEKTKEETILTNVEPIKDPEFTIPVEGEIIRSFAKDSLVYSETLEEWIVHLGIDIKAERTTIVKAAEKGKVLNIKNDPRYGVTVIIEHVNGYKTIYSNLLTTEFITEGESVEKGQSIGTVGNSAAFEIVDEPHLHFEIIKDNVNMDPNIYLK